MTFFDPPGYLCWLRIRTYSTHRSTRNTSHAQSTQSPATALFCKDGSQHRHAAPPGGPPVLIPHLGHRNYRTQMWDKQKEVFLPSTPGLGMHVEVKDPEGKVVLSRQYGSEGRFTFTSHTPGDHQICLHSNSTRMALFAGGRLRVHLDIQVGEHANNYPEIAARDKLTELQLRARQLLDQVEQIQKEQDYQRYREERFRLTSESTNQRVLWWSIAQTVILILTGIWQMRHLKSFFEAKKLV
ncbi:transmembrane emp24 domain-containing protein 4 isoform X1 [Mustela lutreola]|uniref:transmembrane emp24 domain-containing protein 4 isoform X1 n=1 Tax=Mustela lutreola TaxID=9666 RepID=UPI002797BE19|nr:transmembrane emp24 domain-containing protein 4 isoform X1 [Mustela lutreola]